ncbi:AgrD family cyclic lactone autoinducer peptide [Gordoniibacillus kamchatkensis]|nr:cyclic lactone autoinducer peptide [Paenibacillus sp. VKM B-2647]
MKKLAAKHTSMMLSLIALAFVVVASPVLYHRPQVPQDLLKK